MEMANILVAGASTYGVKNAGDDAMFSNLVHGLRERVPDCNITFLARHPNEEFDRVFGVRSIKNFDHDSKVQSLGRWFWGFNPGDRTDHLRTIRQALERCDLLVIGGNSFMEVSKSDLLRGVASYAALLATWAKLFERPYVLYGVAAHPLQDEHTKHVARFVCNNAALVTVREAFSEQQLVDAGVDGGNIRILADPAFGVDPIWDRRKALEVLDKENIRLSSQRIAGVAFRHMYWRWTEKETEHFLRKMARLCDSIVEDLEADILFVPNCTYDVDTQYEDDRVIATMVRNKMDHRTHAHVIQGDYLLPDILSLFQLQDILVSNRRHSCIFGALHQVPLVAMSSGHAWHFEPFMKSLSIPDQVVSFTEDDIESLSAKIKDTWRRRSTISAVLRQVVPELRTKARAHVDLIAQLLPQGEGAAVH